MLWGVISQTLYSRGSFSPAASDVYWCASCMPSFTAFSAQNSLVKAWSLSCYARLWCGAFCLLLFQGCKMLWEAGGKLRHHPYRTCLWELFTFCSSACLMGEVPTSNPNLRKLLEFASSAWAKDWWIVACMAQMCREWLCLWMCCVPEIAMLEQVQQWSSASTGHPTPSALSTCSLTEQFLGTFVSPTH